MARLQCARIETATLKLGGLCIKKLSGTPKGAEQQSEGCFPLGPKSTARLAPEGDRLLAQSSSPLAKAREGH